MAFFDRIFITYKEKRASKELEERYAQLHQLSLEISKYLKYLRGLQANLFEDITKEGEGRMALNKTIFIKDDFTQKLRRFSQETEKRYKESLVRGAKKHPVLKLELEELDRITIFLNNIRKELDKTEEIKAITNRKEKFRLVTELLTEITNMSQKFYQEELRDEKEIREIAVSEISPILKKIYSNPTRLKITDLEGNSREILVAYVTKPQIKQLAEESKKINVCEDKNYKIIWRRWWQDIPELERDLTTGLKDLHVNVTIRLFGEEKKDIHLLLKAA